MVFKVQSYPVPEMGADKKNLGSSPLRGRPFFVYVTPSHEMIFSFMNLQKGFKEINLNNEVLVPGLLSELMSQKYCTDFLTTSIFLGAVGFMHEQ